MEYRPLGRPAYVSSRRAGRPSGSSIGPVSAAEVADCVHAAIDAGVNLIDTAAYYGKGTSEELLGEVLARRLARQGLHLHQGRAGSTAPCSTSPPKARGSASRIAEAPPHRPRRYPARPRHRVRHRLRIRLHRDRETSAATQEGGQGAVHRHVVLPARAVEAGHRAVRPRCRHQLRPLHAAEHAAPHGTAAGRRGEGRRRAERLAAGARAASPIRARRRGIPGQPEIKDACRQAAELCRSRGADIAFLGCSSASRRTRIPSTHHRHREEGRTGRQPAGDDRADRPAVARDVQAISRR